MSNTVVRFFTEKLGNSNATSFIGSAGEIFYDPADGILRLSSGSIPGGIVLASGSGGGGVAIDPSKVAKIGDTMTGALILSGDPVAPLQAATKQYVDLSVSLKAPLVHMHDDRYYTESEIDTKLALYSLTTHNHSLETLTNVSVSSLANDQYLKWNGLSWINATLPTTGGGGATSLNDLTDVLIGGEGPAPGQVLSWSDTDNAWSNIHIANFYPTLDQVKDVDIYGLSNGEYLKYDETSNTWTNGPGTYLYDRMYFDPATNILGLGFGEFPEPTLTADLSSLVASGLANEVRISTDYPDNPVEGSVFISDDTETMYYFVNGAWKTLDKQDNYISDNEDVDTAGATSGQVLTFDGTYWKPVTPTAGGGGGIASVTTFPTTGLVHGLIVENSGLFYRWTSPPDTWVQVG